MKKRGSQTLCRIASSIRACRVRCIQFYNQLFAEEPFTLKTCPMGFGIRFLPLRTERGTLGLLLQQSYSATEIPEDVRLGRGDKKKIQTAISGTPVVQLTDEYAIATMRRAEVLADTLLSGRVAGAVRGLSHQMLTPVQGAINDHMALGKPETAVAERLGTNIEAISILAQKIHLLLRQDISVSPQSIRKVQAHKVAKGVSESLKGVADERHIEVKVGYNAGYLEVEVVPDFFEMILSCLIENAIKYSFAGKPERWRTVEIAFADAGADLEICIENFGCHISKVELEKRAIFELGYRGLHSEDRGREGTGSGLYIVEKMVAAHHGTIDVSSVLVDKYDGSPDPPAQTRFTIRLPVYSPLKDE